MKIKLENYNEEWNVMFEELKKELIDILKFTEPKIEHIGSTAIEGLRAKPIIDILVGVSEGSRLLDVPDALLKRGYTYYEIYDKIMPYRRFFVKHKQEYRPIGNSILLLHEVPDTTEEHDARLAHIHVLEYGSEHWLRHVAFRDYLRSNTTIAEQYQKLKEILSKQCWTDGNDYNAAKDAFIKKEEKKAIDWYLMK